MNTRKNLSIATLVVLLASCSKEAPPARSVGEFLENPILLEAVMVRCAQNRSETKYDAECINAREAANVIAKEENKQRQIELEKQSERKRRALRRRQEAAAEARRRADEARRAREEAEYLGIYEVAPGEIAAVESNEAPQEVTAQELEGNQPGVVVAPPEPEQSTPDDTPPTDIDQIRQELKKRQDGSD